MSGRNNADTVGTNEMMNLRYVAKWTLQQIADKFGISRERVRQRIGNSGNVYHDHVKEVVKDNIHLSNSKLAKLLGFKTTSISRLRNGERHEMDKGWMAVGAEMEQYVSEQLSKRGIKHKLMPHHHRFDILLENGKRVDVKSAEPLEGLSILSPLYSFNTAQEKRGRYADFFICVLRDTKDVFIIPAKETKINGTPIRFCFPEPDMGKKSKWLQYHNRFDLLKG